MVLPQCGNAVAPLSACYAILAGVHVKLVLECGIVLLHFGQRFMHVHIVFARINNAESNVGTVIRCTLKIRQYVRPDESRFNRAFAVLEPCNVPVAQLNLQIINNLLQRFDFQRFFGIIILKCGTCSRQNFGNGTAKHAEFRLCPPGKLDFLLRSSSADSRILTL